MRCRSDGARWHACCGSTFRIVEFCVRGSHIHLLIEAEGPGFLTSAMRSLNTCLARRINERLGRRGKVLADRYHSRVSTTPRQVRSSILYVLQNLRHHAPRRRLPFDPCSSAASFGGWAEPLPDHEPWMRRALASPAATVKPTVWLLTTGWKRGGLLSLAEAPAASRPDG
jgi:hypothetical protein